MEDTRLIEYFFVATRAAVSHSIVFQYPQQNHGHDEYPQSILLFMFPSRSVDAPPAMYNAFVLTTSNGTSLHGASFCMASNASNNHADATTITSICIVSRVPLYTSFLQYLEQLAVLGSRQYRWNTLHPDEKVYYVEQCLRNLMHEVPVPRRGSAGILCSIAETDILLQYTPTDLEFIEYTFQLVHPEHLVALLHHALLEHSILIVGTDNIFITAVSETLRALLAPIHWDHVFIPVVPQGVDVNTLLDAPVPFIAGAHVSQVAHPASLSSPSSIVRFDLRENKIHGSEALLPPLPDASAALIDKIKQAHAETIHLPRQLHERRLKMQHRLRENTSLADTTSTAFLTTPSSLRRKMVKLFNQFILEYLDEVDLGTKKFLASKPSQEKPFFSAWIDTSGFQQYIDNLTPASHETIDEESAAMLDPIHNPLRPENVDTSASFKWDEYSLARTTDVVMFPQLAIELLGTFRPKLPYDMPESEMKSNIPNKRQSSTVVEWLDNWLHGGKSEKSPPAIFHRAKTFGSHLSPRLHFHKTKTITELPHHSWLATHCTPECVQNVAERTRQLDEAWITGAKKNYQLEQAFVDMIHTFGTCSSSNHREDLDAVWDLCLGQAPLPTIFNLPGLWRPFSWLIKTWFDQGDIGTAIAWLAQIQMNKQAPQSSSIGSSGTNETINGLATCMEVEVEPLVHRIYATFGVGSLGLCLQSFNDKTGCQVSGFQHHDESCQIHEDDVIETIDGSPMLTKSFHEIAQTLVDTSRPMTVSFLRGLNKVEDVFQASDKIALRPRREMHDRFGILHEKGIRLTLLSDCAACGHRVSEAELQSQYRSTCPDCDAPFNPFFCVRYINQAPSSPIPYFSWSYLHGRVTNCGSTDEDSFTPLLSWHMKDPHVYWNLVVKCLPLDCPFDTFLVEISPGLPSMLSSNTPDIHALCHFILHLNGSIDRLSEIQSMAKQILEGQDTHGAEKYSIDEIHPSVMTISTSIDIP